MSGAATRSQVDRHRAQPGEIVTTSIAGQSEHLGAEMRVAKPTAFVIASADGRITVANGATRELLARKSDDDLRSLLGPLLTELNSLPQAPDVPHRFELQVPGSADGPGIVGSAQRLDDDACRWLLMLQPADPAAGPGRMMQHAWRLQLLQRLYGTMRHDLNSPIQAASWTFDLLQRAAENVQLTPEQRAKFDESTAIGRKELARLKAAVHRFLSFAVPSAGEPERLDAGELLEDVLRLIAAEASLADVNVTLESRAQAPLVEIERAPFEQALVTLIFVAIDGTARGGTVVIALSEMGGSVEIAIRGSPQVGDPEPGEAEILRSERLSESSGLHAARAIASALGGDLDEHPDANGRAFYLRLPRAR